MKFNWFVFIYFGLVYIILNCFIIKGISQKHFDAFLSSNYNCQKTSKLNWHHVKKNGAKVHPIPQFNHSKWIVVTTIAEPTADLKKLTKIAEWKVVVIGDEKTPSDWSLDGAVFLSVDDQRQLGYKMTAHLPYNSYTRKMIGYLYAIQNGAKYIYDTDDDNHPTGENIHFVLEPTMTGLVYDDHSRPIVNPLSHFGRGDLWPRGYPLEYISFKPNGSYQLCTLKTPAIQQGLVNGDPDVDAIYRLINKGSSNDKNINVTFDSVAPPLTLPAGVFAPFNSQNTLFAYEAFWALFLPTTVAFRVTDIWRSYWAQTLLWLTGQRLAFFPPNAIQFRNAHNYLKDFDEELQMYQQVGALIEFLSVWQCRSKTNLFHCIIQLTNDMVAAHYFEIEDIKLVKFWLLDLKTIGYRKPALNVLGLHETCCMKHSKTWVHYSPLGLTTIPSGYYDLLSLCSDVYVNQNSNKTSLLFQNRYRKPTYKFDNILLVIVFNHPHLSNVRLLETLYRDHFPNMLFCSETSSYANLMKEINTGQMPWRTNGISFVNRTFNLGEHSFECAVRAIEMNYKVDGYLMVGDDVLVKPWNLTKLEVSQTHISNEEKANSGHRLGYQLRHEDNIKQDNDWWTHVWLDWWLKPAGKVSTNKALDAIASIAKNSSDDRSNIMKQYLDNREASNLSSFAVCDMTDIYFISQQDAKMFSVVANQFLKHKVCVEIAVPTITTGLRLNDLQLDDTLVGVSTWYESRDNTLEYLTDDMVYVHPHKLSSLQNNKELKKQYCLNYVSKHLINW